MLFKYLYVFLICLSACLSQYISMKIKIRMNELIVLMSNRSRNYGWCLLFSYRACFQMRRHVKSGSIVMGGLSGIGMRPLPTIPSSYSVHDFHMYGIHAMGITPG